MMTLEDLVKVPNTFHWAGWVHRDISAGSLFLLQGKLFKLGDLEFAKMGKDGEHDVRTGMLDFMSIEVERQTGLSISL
ncbi:hypothetical protein AX14_003700 [Amanita brunnescens Koide BX004]|nr:hypothetical protein AX14_003700 [Amanita brunnescens Koide BX004]